MGKGGKTLSFDSDMAWKKKSSRVGEFDHRHFRDSREEKQAPLSSLPFVKL